MSATNPTPYGYCECGCGGKTNIPTETNRSIGRIKGQPMRFLAGHSSRLTRRTGPDWSYEDRGHTTPCKIWQHGLNAGGYGRIGVGPGKQQYTHIVEWEAANGPVPDGLELDHLCRQRACGEATHLEAVTHAENVARGLAGATGRAHQLAKTHCPQGHPYAGDNLYVSRDGKRHCRECRRAVNRRRRAARRAPMVPAM